MIILYFKKKINAHSCQRMTYKGLPQIIISLIDVTQNGLHTLGALVDSQLKTFLTTKYYFIMKG